MKTARWLLTEIGWRSGVAAIYVAGLIGLLLAFLWVAVFDGDKLKAERRRYYNEA